MAALPDFIHLRRHALPAHIAAELHRELDRRDIGSVRSVPRAVWHAGQDGRLTCLWTAGPVFAAGNPPFG